MTTLFRQNMGTLDRTIRLCIGVVFLTLSIFFVKGIGATILLILSVPLLFTGISGFCILYVPFGMCTKREHKGEA